MTVEKYENRFFNSLIWNKFHYRADDIIIASYAKSGTTLVQQIAAQLIFSGDGSVNVSAISPWIDSVYPAEEVKLKQLADQTHRRFIKTHLPADYIAFAKEAKYLYIIRDGRDIACSLYRHQNAISENAQAVITEKADNNKKLRVIEAPSQSLADYFSHWLEYDGQPFWPFWENVRSWWALRNEANVLLLHFDTLTADLPMGIQQIAHFLDIELKPTALSTLLEHTSFDFMKANAERYVPEDVALWKDGGKAFFHKGQGGTWKDYFSSELSEKYLHRAEQELGYDCAQWLLTGKLSTFSR